MNKQAFTVIELLVVIAVIGMLASIVLVSLKGTREKASIAKAEQFASSVNHVLGAYAVGIWTFDEGIQGSALDASGYGNNGTVNGATLTADRKGQANKAYSFDGVDDYVAVGNSASLQNLPTATLEAWIKPTTLSGYNNVIARTTYSNGGLILRASQGGDKRPIPHVFIDTWYTCQGSTIPLNQWTHLVATYDGTTLRGYINGVQDCSVIPAVGGNLLSNSTPWNIGADPDQTGSLFNGLIDEVRVYSVALTVGEIQKHYAEGLEKHNLTLSY